MGIYIKYQAMPECDLLERSRRDSEFGSYLWSFRYCIKEETPFDPPITSIQLEFIQEAKRTAQLYPGLENRNWEHYKHCTRFLYAVMDKRKKGTSDGDWTELLDKAIAGSETVHERVKDIMGHPICYVTPIEIKQIIELFSSLFITNKMVKIYFDKFIAWKPYESDPFGYKSDFSDFWDCLERSVAWYKEAAAHNEGMLVRLS